MTLIELNGQQTIRMALDSMHLCTTTAAHTHYINSLYKFIWLCECRHNTNPLESTAGAMSVMVSVPNNPGFIDLKPRAHQPLPHNWLHNV